MHKICKIVVFTVLALIAAITVTSPQSVYAASPSSIATPIQAGSLHLSSVARQNIHTAVSSLSPITSKNRLVPEDPSPTCFNVTITVAKTGTKTNTFTVHGLATFFCGHMYGGGVEIVNSISCPAAFGKPASSYKAFPLKIYGNVTWNYLQPFTAYCEGCTDHVPDYFPYFAVTTSTYVSSFRAPPGENVNNPASYTESVDGTSAFVNTGFANSSTYRIPC